MRVVQLCDFGDDGDAEYRMHAPSRMLGQQPGISVVDCHFASRRARDLALEADLVIIQFHYEWDLLALVAERRRLGRPTVFEANDYFFDLQPWSPLREWWSDRNVQELYSRLLWSADGVQTSSESLAGQWRRRGARQVAVFPNQLVDPEPLPSPRTGPFTIGWAGSPGHFADWWAIAPVLQRWLAANPEVHLAVMCNGYARDFITLPSDRYHFQEFAPLPEYLAFLRRLDVGVAPLLPTDYNRGRSDVKFLEYASAGVVGVYSDLDPYRDAVVHGETGLIYHTPEELVAALDRVHRDVDLRVQIRSRAHEWVTETRLLVDHIGERTRWYRELIESARSARRTGVPIVGDATPDNSDGSHPRAPVDDYVEVHLGASEEHLRVILEGAPAGGHPDEKASTSDRVPAGDAAIEALAALLAGEPDYVAARQRLGLLLNNAGRPREALDVLEAARKLAPESAVTSMEIGRSHLLLGDGSAAKAELVPLVSQVPGFIPGWEYLVRLLRVVRDPDSTAWAARALQTFPVCYPLGLAAIESFAVNDAARLLADLIDRIAPGLTRNERPRCLAAVQKSLGAVLGAQPEAAPALRLLSSAARGFPESATIAGWHGDVLRQVGQLQEATAELSRAATLRRNAAAVATETPVDEPLPWAWTFAEVAQGSVTIANQAE